jgi:hypothetical protein
MTFAGKVAGSLTENPHVAKRTGSGTIQPPSSFAGEATTAQYAVRAAQDGTTDATVLTSTNGQYAQELFSFAVQTALQRAGAVPLWWDVANQLKAALKAITAKWVGYGVGANAGAAANGATVKVWIPVSSSWSSGLTNTASAPSSIAITYGGAGATAPTDRVDANGFLHLLAQSTYSSDGTRPSTVYTDYAELQVQVATQTEATLRFPHPWLVNLADPDTSVPLRITAAEWQLTYPQSITDVVTLDATRKKRSVGNVLGAETEMLIVANHRDPRTFDLAERIRAAKALPTTWLLKMPQLPGALMASIPGRQFEVSLGELREIPSPSKTVLRLPVVEVGDPIG